jgi:hypothetical protein
VAATAPTGWAGAANAASYVCVAWTTVCVAAAVIRDPAIVRPLLGLLVVGVMVEMEEAWLSWWGGEDPTRPIIGTFYWWDPLAAYLIPGAAIGYAAFLRGRRHVAALGLAGFALGTVGLAYSTSRAAGVCFAVAVLVLSAAHLRDGWRSVKRVAIGLGSAAVVAWAVGGPPFFPHHDGGFAHTPIAGTVARGSGESLGQNGEYRLQFWREAWHVFERHPVVGGGYHSLGTESLGHVPDGWARSPLAHSGYLQAVSDGGLVLSIPFLLGCGAIAVFVLIALVSAVRRRDFSVTSLAVPLVLGAMLVHSAVDFDWSYPADFVLTGILAGLVAGQRWRSRPQSSSMRTLVACGVLVGVVTLGVGAAASWSGDLRLSLPVSQGASR